MGMLPSELQSNINILNQLKEELNNLEKKPRYRKTNRHDAGFSNEGSSGKTKADGIGRHKRTSEEEATGEKTGREC